ncbi:MAG: hypothetical protein MZV65_35930 [Chromatiales bacterium]|nr:hypothetical protein [Chromatiales bacterium]
MGDTASADFVIFVGSSPFEGNYGPTNRVPRITERLASGDLKFAVIDPRLSKIARQGLEVAAQQTRHRRRDCAGADSMGYRQ